MPTRLQIEFQITDIEYNVAHYETSNSETYTIATYSEHQSREAIEHYLNLCQQMNDRNDPDEYGNEIVIIRVTRFSLNGIMHTDKEYVTVKLYRAWAEDQEDDT